MNNKKKIILRLAVFLILVLGLTLWLFSVFGLHDEKNAEGMFDEFYSQRDNSIDVMWYGASAVNAYYNPIQAYEETGITSFALSSSQEPLILTSKLIDETLKTQKPKLIVIEIRNISKDDDAIQEPAVRRVTDGMNIFSINRFETVTKSLDFMKSAGTEIKDEWSYYIPFGKYHSRWSTDIEKSDFIPKGRITQFKGFAYNSSSNDIKSWSERNVTKEIGNPDKNQKKEFIELLDYCDKLKEDGTDVLFVLAPHKTGKNSISKANWAFKEAKKRGYKGLNFNDDEDDLEKLGIVPETDYKDIHHVNIIGMKKYTSYVSNYINNHYDLEDHRNDSDYEDWDESVKYCHKVLDPEYEKMKKRINK